MTNDTDAGLYLIAGTLIASLVLVSVAAMKCLGN